MITTSIKCTESITKKIKEKLGREHHRISTLASELIIMMHLSTFHNGTGPRNTRCTIVHVDLPGTTSWEKNYSRNLSALFLKQ